MKKTIMLFAVLMATLVTMAKPVTQQEALRVAQAWLNAKGMKNVAALQDVTAQTPFTEFYVFAAPEGGYALVSSDDCARPILGYSVTSRFVANDMPEHVRWFLAGYDKEIRQLKSRQLPSSQMLYKAGSNPDARPAEWQALLSGNAPKDAGYTPVAPLITTTWNQSPYYNSLCPSDGNGQAVTGCVATATAQVMKYYNHPTQGYGSHTYTSSRVVDGVSYIYPNLTANFGTTTYQWSQMPNALDAASSTAQVNAVATLMYHVGVADEMYYSPQASGAQNYYPGEMSAFRASSQESLARYFKYRPDMAAVDRCSYSDAEYCAILRGEIAQQRPVLYSGSDPSGGHSFVLDGYDANGYFHVNWGWGGSNDDYYAIGALNPGEGGTGGNATYTFNDGNVALIGIQPNTSWGTSSPTSIGAYMQNMAPVGASAMAYDRTTGSPTSVYSFGDTAVLMVSMPEGYRFAGWTDGDSYNPREILATGGNYNFEARCAFIGASDTVTYCIGGPQSLSPYASGVKFPASALNPTKQLTDVLFFAYRTGTYTVTVYTGANHENTAAVASLTVYAGQENAWQTVTLANPVEATSDMWIMISSSDATHPVTLTTYSGVPSSLLLEFNGDIQEYGAYWEVSAMIKGVFGSDVEVSGDTVSYCGNNTPNDGGVGTGSTSTKQWGVMFPAGSIQGDYLKSAMLYVLDGYTGAYTLKVYRGGDTVPGTLAHSQVVNFTGSGWQEALLDAAFAIGNENIWVTFSTTGMTYPMSGCEYTGSPNSDWYTLNGTAWYHIGPDLNFSWLIKAVTSQTPPSSFPPPTVAINGQTRLGTGTPYTFTATATDGANVTWTLQGASPASATGTTATATWSTSGYYRLIATATNSYGTGHDTLWVQVVDYTAGDTLSYIHGDMHLTNVGTGSASPFSWGIMMPPAFIGNRTQITGVQAGLAEIGTYTLTIYQGGNDAPGTQVATYTFNTTAADTATGTYFTYTLPTPLAINNASNLWVVIGSTDLAYPAGTVYHIDDPNSDWTLLNGNWYHLPQLGINGSWEIKILTGAGSTPQPTQYTITVMSNNDAWGTVTGGGTYNEGDTATLQATANTGYHFVEWQDGNTQNPRTITVTGNATYTATFEADATPQDGDTVSYCGNSTSTSSFGTNGGALEWGIMLPPSSFNGAVYLKSVMIYVAEGQSGAYTLNLYRGGDTLPGTLAHTQTANFGSSQTGWQEVFIDATFALNSQNLWITFATNGQTYPMAVCNYTGAPNSDWINLGDGWGHFAGLGFEYSWMIKAVTTSTAPMLPPPTVGINGQTRLGTGMPYTFTATATDGANVTWTLQGASPASATGTTATATWSTSGYYRLIATATNSYGTGHDTLWVQVVDYTAGDTLSYIHGDMHLTNVGTGSASAFSWGIMMPPAFIGNRTQITGVQAGLAEIGTYTLTVYQGGDNAPQTQVVTYTFNTTAADTAADTYFTYTLPTPLTISNSSNLWVVIGSTDLAYPAGTVYHIDDPNSDWTLLNGNWYHLPQLGINGSWEIKILTGAGSTPQPTQYTINVASNNNAWGTVTGGGTYNSGATATLTATPASGYRFVSWNDSNTQNPRTITVTGNAAYMAIFEADGTPQPTGDTVSYCGNSAPQEGGVGTNSTGTKQWGIMLPANMMTNNYLKSVMLYVLDGYTGAYTLNIYRGGDTVPGTLAHSQVVNFTSSGWQEAQLDAVFALNSQNLWITFSTTGMTYPMSVCDYTGSPNSDWYTLNGTTWNHIGPALNYSWLIKAVTSQTPPSSFPPPTVAINGQTRLGTGVPYTFTATATDGANVTWTLQGASPASATGTTATATWSTSGYYRLIATATNSYGTGHDTLWVQVVDYTAGDTLSYIHGDMHLINVGTGSASPFSWGIMMPPAFIGNRTQITGVQAGLAEIGTYTLTIYQGGNDAPGTQVATYTFNTTAADTATGTYFTYTLPTPLTISNSSNLWVVIGSTDLAYPAGTVYHIDDPNSDWTLLNGSWYHLPQLGINGSWEIKILTGAGSTPQPTQYTITVMSNNDAWGTVTGGGTYNEGDTATLTAMPATGYHFVSWNDADTSNPRQVTVTGNDTYIATFAANVGIDDVEGAALALTPNPATDMVTVSGVKAGSNMTLLDVTGHAVFTQAIKQSDNQAITIDVSMLPCGVYFVRVSDGAVIAVRKLIVK